MTSSQRVRLSRQPRLQLGIGEARIDLIVQLVDHLGRRRFGAPRPNQPHNKGAQNG